MVSVEERGSLSEKSSVRLNGELAPEEEKDVSDQNFKLEQSPDSVFDARPYTLKRYQGASAEMREDSSNEDLLIDDKEQISDNAGARLSIDKHQHQAQESHEEDREQVQPKHQNPRLKQDQNLAIIPTIGR